MFAEEMTVWEKNFYVQRHWLNKYYIAEKQKMIKQIMVYLPEDT